MLTTYLTFPRLLLSRKQAPSCIIPAKTRAKGHDTFITCSVIIYSRPFPLTQKVINLFSLVSPVIRCRLHHIVQAFACFCLLVIKSHHEFQNVHFWDVTVVSKTDFVSLRDSAFRALQHDVWSSSRLYTVTSFI